MANNKFNFWVPLELTKAKDEKTGKTKMCLKGIASTMHEDSDGEFLDPKGFDLSYLNKSGVVNWHHQVPNKPLAVIGEPTKAEIKKEGLYLECELYQDSSIAKEVYELAEILEKNSKTRRLGFSVEGTVTERQPGNDKVITGADITGVAVTHMPKNSHTFAEIMKGKIDYIEPEFEKISTEKIGSEDNDIIMDICKADGSKVLVTSAGDIIQKAKSTIDITNELFGDKTLKKDVYQKIFSNNSGITFEKAQKVYNLTIKNMANKGTKKVTDDEIQKAYDALNLKKGKKEIPSSSSSSSSEASSSSEEPKKPIKKAMASSSSSSSSEEPVKKIKKGKGALSSEMPATSSSSSSSEEPKKKIKKACVNKAVSSSSSSSSSEEPKKPIKKAKMSSSSSSSEVSSEEPKKEIKKSKDDVLIKALGTVVGDLVEQINGLKDQISEIGNQSAGGRKSISKAIEKFDEKEEGSDKTLSISKDKTKILNLLEHKTFQKGYDEQMANALSKFEISNQLPLAVAQRILTEDKIEITQ